MFSSLPNDDTSRRDGVHISSNICNEFSSSNVEWFYEWLF